MRYGIIPYMRQRFEIKFESDEQRERFEQAASKTGAATFAGWIRMVLTAEANRLLGEKSVR